MHGIRPGAWLLIGLFCTACLAGVALAGMAQAEAVAQVPEALRACVSQKEDSQRLSCYDREIARLDQRAEVAASPTATTAAAAAVVSDEKFGLPDSVISREEAEQRKAQQLQGKIIGLASRPHGERVLTLDNNQVWVEKSADPMKIRLKVGDEVVIKRGALGSFLLFNAGRSVRVTRVQ